MTLAINDEHQELSRVARAFLEDQDARAAARALLDAPQAALPPFWKQLAELGWLGLHLPERFGGEGFGLLELGVVVEALGHAVAPGPYLPTVLTSAVVLAAGEDALREEWLPGLADGSVVGGVALRASLSRDASGGLDGRAEIVLGADLADLLLLPVGEDLVLLERNQLGVEIETLENLDPTRRVAAVRCHGVSLASSRVLPGALDVAVRLGRSLAVAEAAGGAHACSEMATAYAAERVQFGRPIATFQAVKHHCANMRVAAEQATALAWDALQSASDTGQGDLSAAAAAAIALPAFEQCAKQNIQVHGGIGFTWEHDAHLYLRRAKALQAIFGSAAEAEREVAKLSLAGVRSERGLELPAEAAAYRNEARDFVTRYRALPVSEQRAALADSGYLTPHWPKPWGRAAGPVEQIVIEEEFASLERPNLGIGGWVTLTLAQNASEEQRQRWVRPSLMGDIVWCQLFSEPGAGSDAAAVQTRAVRVEGGWRVSGQKVWTSNGQRSTHGLATVRTSSEGRKHAGISVMVIGMQATGVDVRPLREITGKALFSEIFFDDVFVPDSDVVGEVNQGWAVARSTLGNERISIGGGEEASLADELSSLVQERAAEDPDALRELGALLAEDLSLRLMNLRELIRAVEGAEPRATGNVSKLIQSVHRQRCAEFRLQLRGSGGALLDASGDAFDYLFTRALTIAGGTSEIVRNQIGERILGLPRDPLIR